MMRGLARWKLGFCSLVPDVVIVSLGVFSVVGEIGDSAVELDTFLCGGCECDEMGSFTFTLLLRFLFKLACVFCFSTGSIDEGSIRGFVDERIEDTYYYEGNELGDGGDACGWPCRTNTLPLTVLWSIA